MTNNNYNAVNYVDRNQMIAQIISFFRDKREENKLGFDLHTTPKHTSSESTVVFKLVRTMSLVKFVIGDNGCFVHHLRRNPQGAAFILHTHKMARNERFLPDALDKQLEDAWVFINISTEYRRTISKIKAVGTIAEFEKHKASSETDVVLCAQIKEVEHTTISGNEFVQYVLASGETYSIPEALVRNMRHMGDGPDNLVVNCFGDSQIYTVARSQYVFSFDHENLEVPRGSRKESYQEGCSENSTKESGREVRTCEESTS